MASINEKSSIVFLTFFSPNTDFPSCFFSYPELNFETIGGSPYYPPETLRPM